MVKSILIVGVGGQGTLLTSRILGNLALSLGHDVKMSEVHGMAQRGGSVVTHVRYGDKVDSPLVEAGTADVILAFEKMEALRWLHFLKKDGKVIINDQSIDPMPVIMGIAAYPDDCIKSIQKKFPDAVLVDALKIAEKLGNFRVANTVLVGKLAKTLDISKEKWVEAIAATVPPKTIDVNTKAFYEGYK